MNMSLSSDLARADQIVRELSENPSRFGLPEVVSVEIVTGGVAHHVYRIDTREGRFYLKHRGSYFPKIPGIRINPMDIGHEHRALSLLSALLPGCFPRILFYDPERAFMVLADAMPGESAESGTLESLLLKRCVTAATLQRLGELLRRIHDATQRIVEPIRDGGDDEFFALKLQHRFGHRNTPSLKRIINELTYNSPRQIIIGDPSPKNIGVSDAGTRLMFFDLEDVHRGCVLFDVGFCLGHLILHAQSDPQQALAYLEAFSDGYGNRGLSDSELAKAIALGTIIYRLDGMIPYPVPLSPEGRTGLLGRTEATLIFVETYPMSWEVLVEKLLQDR